MGPIDPEERLKGIATFVQAAEAGSFTLAASRLRQTRSAVGKAIARLERRLGTRLFHRTTRLQSLTESGQAFYERCKRALAEIDAAEAALDASQRALTGRLRVSAPLLLGRHLVAPVLARLAARHPAMELELSFSDRVVDLVGEGFDLGVRLGALRDSSSLAARSLGRFDFVICAAPAYLAQHGTPGGPAEAARHTAIVYAGGLPEAPWLIEAADGRTQEFTPHQRVRFDDLQAIADAALAGIGLARLPRWLAAPQVRTGALCILWARAHEHRMEVHAVWPHNRHLAAKTRAAIDALVEAVPPWLMDGSDDAEAAAGAG